MTNIDDKYYVDKIFVSINFLDLENILACSNELACMKCVN